MKLYVKIQIFAPMFSRPIGVALINLTLSLSHSSDMSLVSFYRFLPESPRWLLIKGKTDEAYATLTVIAKGNKTVLPDMNKLTMGINENNVRALF